MLWDLIQQYQIGQLGQKIDRANDDIAVGSANVKAATRLNDKVDRLILLCQAMFELMQQTTGVTEEQLNAKVAEIHHREGLGGSLMTPKGTPCPKCGAIMSPQFGGCQFCGYRETPSAPALPSSTVDDPNTV